MFRPPPRFFVEKNKNRMGGVGSGRRGPSPIAFEPHKTAGLNGAVIKRFRESYPFWGCGSSQRYWNKKEAHPFGQPSYYESVQPDYVPLCAPRSCTPPSGRRRVAPYKRFRRRRNPWRRGHPFAPSIWKCRRVEAASGAGTKKERHDLWSCLSFGASDEARTRYLHLGKVALYQMSYTRNSRVYISRFPPRCQHLFYFSSVSRPTDPSAPYTGRDQAASPH